MPVSPPSCLVRHASPRTGVIWLTGRPCAGKTTLARALEQRIGEQGLRCYRLDGDDLRAGLNRDLGYSATDRAENIRRAAEVARLLMDAGLLVIAAFVSPFRDDRHKARETIGDDAFIEVHVDVPLDVAERRDSKGLYRRARRGELRDVTGIDSAYEAPDAPDVHVDTARLEPAEAAQAVLQALADRGWLWPAESPAGDRQAETV